MTVKLHNPGSGHQVQLELTPPSPVDPNIGWLEKLLADARTWMSAKDICLTTNGRLIDRDIREYASKSEWIISGQKGYKHIMHSNLEEIGHACNWMESQARKMINRARRLRDNGHKILK